MLIATHQSLDVGGVIFIVLSFASSQRISLLNILFLFVNLNLPNPNVMKRLHNAYYHTKTNLEPNNCNKK